MITDEKEKLVFVVNEPVNVGGFVKKSSFTVKRISRHWMAGAPLIGFRQLVFPCPLFPFSTCGVPNTMAPPPRLKNAGVPYWKPSGSAIMSATMNWLALLPPDLTKLGNVTLKSIAELVDAVAVIVVALAVVVAVAVLPAPAVAVDGTLAIGT